MVAEESQNALCAQSKGEENYVCLAAISHHEPTGCRDWIVDSAATCHLAYEKSTFENYRKMPTSTLNLGAGTTTTIVGVGDVYINVQTRFGVKKCLMRDVKHAPRLGYNILSVSTTTKQGAKVIFDEFNFSITSKKNGGLISEGILHNGLYRLNCIKAYTRKNRSMSKLKTEKFGNVQYVGSSCPGVAFGDPYPKKLHRPISTHTRTKLPTSGKIFPQQRRTYKDALDNAPAPTRSPFIHASSDEKGKSFRV